MEISRHGRIDDLGKLLLGVQPAERSTVKSAAGPQPAGGTDRVDISDAAKELQRARESAQSDPPDRAEKVAMLRDAVESGTYTVSGRKVADQLLRQTLIDSVL